MPDLSFAEVEEILRLVQRIEGCDVTLTWGDLSVHVHRGGAAATPTTAATTSTDVPAQPVVEPAPRDQSAPTTNPFADVPEHWVSIEAPMVGTFYRTSAPEEPPFVEVGDDVEPGATVGLVEVMKLFTELTCDVAGKVARIDVDNGAFVEYGQPLLWIEPA